MTDDKVGRQSEVGARGAQPLDDAQVIVGPVLAVHPRQNDVRSRLHRQMHPGHQGGHLGMGGDEVLGHVAGVRGGVADPREPLDPCERADEAREAPVRAAVRAVIGVDVLAKQRDLAHAPAHQRLGLGEDAGGRAALLGAAGIGDDAEGAELVAPLLHRQEGRGRGARAPLRQVVELVLGRKLGIDRALARLGPAQKVGQAVIGLRPHDQIDKRRAREDLGAFGLRHAARDRDAQIGTLGLERAQPADVGIDLFGRLLADVAGVEDDEVGILGALGRAITLRRERLSHALGIIDVHLAAVGLDECLAPLGHRAPPW